jgi:hypothetical protein
MIPSSTTLRRIDESTKTIGVIAHATREDTETLLSLQKTRELMKWVAPESIDPDESFESALKVRHRETGKWFLESVQFQEFLASDGGLFWLYGKRTQFTISFGHSH